LNAAVATTPRRAPVSRPAATATPALPVQARNDADIPVDALAEVAACRKAAADCAFVIMGYFHIAPEALFKSTRGAAEEAFPRQLMMAGLVTGLGFSSLTVGRAVGRDKATVEHACRIIEAIRVEAGRSDGLAVHAITDMLGEDGVRDFLDGRELYSVVNDDDELEWKGGARVLEFLKHADMMVEDFFRAFRLVAINGSAYREELMRRKAQMAEKGMAR